MKLTAAQAYDIERALMRGRKIDAVAVYRKATGAGLTEAKAEVEKIEQKLRKEKPWYFKGQTSPTETPESISDTIKTPGRAFGPKGLILFLLVDVLIFGALIYFFLFDRQDRGRSTTDNSNRGNQAISPKSVDLPKNPDSSTYFSALDNDERFNTLYRAKISSDEYIARKKSNSSRDYDGSLLERKIKSARSLKSSKRVAPDSVAPLKIPGVATTPLIDGLMGDAEWSQSMSMDIANQETRLYLQVSGEWLFVACDAPAELTSGGYDQMRLYFHSGLLKKLDNERIHVGRGPGVTSIRQTRFR